MKLKKLIVGVLVAVLALTGLTIVPEPTRADNTIIPEGFTPVYTIADLYGINSNLNGNYILL